ncbi:OmpA domain protein [Oceanicola granulosus HTCC2516]|uniref:OmpA domain protein n=1 Tax=Oceanicola granulosus (strain ATCC BAA-861 / DSM 15982 / KCTC 12143 / HTCC2516) TaxID=314256 RepID=Q2CCF2_OCEGH|nr:OmpA family protein [Oceanicola granulosus]EAR50366.1 OmpA domain protein [Oceanicola granulosus HTCC2516]
MRSFLVPLLAFVLAALLSVFGARAAVGVVEDRSVVAVREAMAAEGQDWVSVIGDGLQVILEGEAPSEAVRFRTMTIAGTQVDASRVIDNMSVADSSGIEPPAFGVEILRNDAGVSLIGLIPASADRARIQARVAEIADGLPVTDLLETADHATPADWEPAMTFALSALRTLPRAKVSVSPGAVDVIAMAESPEAKERLEADLAQRVPEDVALAVEVSAPRPVITPFVTRFILDGEGPRFSACAADTEAAAALIAEAAQAAGYGRPLDCPLGLGVPALTWGEAVADAIAAIDALGGGTVTVSDADVSLVAALGTEQEAFDRVVGELENSLPDLFALEAVLPQPPEEGDDGPVEFTATRSPEGGVQLRGQVGDDLVNTTAENFARAKFADSDITMGTRLAEDLPQGWSVRVLAGLEALSKLEHGAVTVTPDRVDVRGVSGLRDASGEISRLLIGKFGESADFEIDVTYEEAFDPLAALPTPEECLAKIKAISDTRKITFDPGSADIDGDSQRVVDDIAEVLRQCTDLEIEVAGYTDSQGREEMNQRLSQQRAEAVLAALRLRRVPVGAFRAVGYGEAEPIADNDTAEGREANRRIEFRLIEPVAEEVAETDGAAAAGEDGDDEQN